MKLKKIFKSSHILSLLLALTFTIDAQAQAGKSYSTVKLYGPHQAAVEMASFKIDSMMEAQNIPGVQIAVMKKGQTIWSDGFGFSDLEESVPMDTEAKLRIGSVSKTMTSAALGVLHEAGRLNLDAPVQKYVPYFPEKKYTITIRQVAGHLAGIRHYRGEEFLSSRHYETVREGLDIFKDDTLLFEPGTDYNYSTYGWNLVSAVVEGASGSSFLTYMRKNVFQPLGMYSTTAEFMRQIIEDRTDYYVVNDSGRVENAPYVDNSYKWAGGGFLSTAEDLLLFGDAFLGNDYLQRDTIHMLWKSQETRDGEPTNYGIGWSSGSDDENRKWYGHSGGSVGGSTQFVVFPDQELVLAVVANLSGVDYGELHLDIADLFMR
ncbi:MAG: serine hydrolase domain-containing protein [Balneolaceae bacterium]|nr:serine hydrolase domain-containing protein [Balneolaceae bacterium]